MRTLYCYVVKVVFGQCLVRVIKSIELNPGIANSYAGKWGWVNSAELVHDDKEKRLTAADVYDGEDFYPERMKNMAAAKRVNKDMER